MSLTRRQFVRGALAAAAAIDSGLGAASDAQPDALGVEVKDDRTVLDFRVGGRPFAVYNYGTSHAGTYRPFFHPIMGPNDREITQNGEFPGTLRGHYWHPGLFVAHQKINGVSFWEERQADCGKIAHLGFDEVSSGSSGKAVQRLAWRDLAGADLIHETRTIRVPAIEPDRRYLDLTLKLTAVKEALTFAATPYNLLACRVINAICRVQEKQQYAKRYGALVDFAPPVEGGRITNSEGKVDDACRGARARWCDFSGPLGDGTRGGISILDHPSNPRHPTPWHNWNNMTITASFTFHEPFVLNKGDSLRVSYRVLVHANGARTADVDEHWKLFAGEQPA